MRSRILPWLFCGALLTPICVRAGDALPFAPPQDVAVATNPAALAAGDVNRDGRADLVTVHPDTDTAWVGLAQAAGGFTFVGPLHVGVAPCAVQVADVNH